MASTHVIEHWNPEDEAFWATRGRSIAARNLWLSIPPLVLAFAVWMLWSAIVVHLPAAGFRYSTNQLYWLAALPALSGAALRIVYSVAVPAFGGRRWTTWSTASLLLPALGMGFALRSPDTPYEVMLGLALLCGLGGGHFASAMAHINFFYPKARKGYALGLSAGLGHLGVPLALVVVPLAVTTAPLGAIGGSPLVTTEGTALWLGNAGFVWVPFIAASALTAWLGMDDLADARGGIAEQAAMLRHRHHWLMCALYLGTFGSFIGYAAGFPLLAQGQFPEASVWQVAWAGPLLGALVRPLGGWLADRVGGARVTLWSFVAMTLGVLAVLASLPRAGHAGSWGGFLAAFVVLFTAAGLGNGSTFRMIPLGFVAQRQRAADPTPSAQARALRDGNRDGAASLGVASAVGTVGGFFVPKSYGTSIALTGSPDAALAAFAVFYLFCIALTWWFYARPFAPMPC